MTTKAIDPRWAKRKDEARIPPADRLPPPTATEPEQEKPSWERDPRWAALEKQGVIGGTPDMVVDIEAIEDPECPPPPEKDPARDTFPAAGHWRVVVIGCAWMVGGHLKKLGCVAGATERQKLEAFVKIFEPDEHGEDGKVPRIVGWSSRRYDLPVIAARCMRYGIPWPWYHCETRGRNPRYRYSFERHLDLMDAVSDQGATRAMQLDGCARMIGLPGKLGDVSGKDVERLVNEGRLREVEHYCLQDVAQTAAIHLRRELTCGRLKLADYRLAIASWLEAVEGTPGAADLLADAAGVPPVGLNLPLLTLEPEADPVLDTSEEIPFDD